MELPAGVPVLRRELIAAGLTNDEVARARRDGRLHRLRRGAYVHRPADPSDASSLHRLAVAAALRTVSGETVVSHASAAVVHGIGLWRVPLYRVELTRPRRSGARAGPDLRLHAAALLPDEVTVAGGIPVTTVARTVADLVRTLPFDPAVALADSALFLRLTTPDELADAVQRARGRPGNAAARRAIAAADGRADGPGETCSRLLIVRAGLPVPDLQHGVHDGAGRLLGRVDFWWEDERVAGEFDGQVKYGRLLRPGQDAGEAVFVEKVREDGIRAEDVAVVRWIWRDLRNRATFAATVDRLTRALTRRR